MLVQRARDNLVRRRVLQPRRRPGRARLRRPLGRDRPRGHGARPRAAVRGGADALHGRPPGRRDRAAARHAAAPAGAHARCPTCASSGGSSARRAPGRGRSAATSRALLEPEAEVYAALCLGRARLRAQERLRARRARAVGRDRLDARGADRGRRARRRPRDRGRDALALLLRGHAERRPRARGEPRHPVHRPADRAGDGGLRADARRRSSRGASPTSPRRTCRRGSAATC